MKACINQVECNSAPDRFPHTSLSNMNGRKNLQEKLLFQLWEMGLLNLKSRPKQLPQASMHLMAISCSHKRVNRKIKRCPVRGSVRIVLDRIKGNKKEKAPIPVGQWKSDEITDIYRPSPDRRYFGQLALLSCLIAWLCWGIWGGWTHHHAMRLGRANHLRKPFLKYVWWLVVGEWILVLLTFFLVAWLVCI